MAASSRHLAGSSHSGTPSLPAIARFEQGVDARCDGVDDVQSRPPRQLGEDGSAGGDGCPLAGKGNESPAFGVDGCETEGISVVINVPEGLAEEEYVDNILNAHVRSQHPENQTTDVF